MSATAEARIHISAIGSREGLRFDRPDPRFTGVSRDPEIRKERQKVERKRKQRERKQAQIEAAYRERKNAHTEQENA